MEPLTDGIATLRRFRVDDVTRIIEACSDAESARFIPSIPVPYTRADAETYLACADELWNEGRRLPFAIVPRPATW